jgi:hypothetical protein
MEAFLRTAPVADMDYRYYGEAHLLLGFLRHDRGHTAEARQVWERGTHPVWLARWRSAHPREELSLDAQLAGTKMITHLLLASLSGTLSQETIDEITVQAVQVMLDDASARAFKSLLRLTPELYHDLWQSVRGVEAARKLALRSVPWPTYQRLPVTAMGVGVLRQGALTGKPTADQEALIWKLSEDVSDAYFVSGKLGKQQLFSLTAAWSGVTGAFGWGGVQASLPAHLRGPLAYVLGQRYAHKLKNVKEGRAYLQAALDEAMRQPPNPLLQRLARSELDRLKAAP